MAPMHGMDDEDSFGERYAELLRPIRCEPQTRIAHPPSPRRSHNFRRRLSPCSLSATLSSFAPLTQTRLRHRATPSDLAQNWNIDVASELEDYMEDLEHIKISFDDGETELNFAEAAMLIQGSTCVYSRKVEFLYSLVLQTLMSNGLCTSCCAGYGTFIQRESFIAT